ncbi:MAG: polymerase ECF-type sigma factor [Bradyrhizobium sp.]|nr:polymerase ECF-type sigma factor [Bradyrhizobium sp.]
MVTPEEGRQHVRQENVSDQEQLNRRWRPALMAFFLRRVRNHSEAEDLTQEVFVRMLNNAGSASQPDVYVFQIAQNLLVDRARKNVVRERYREGLAVETDRDLDVLDPHSIAEGREQLAAFTAALGELPERTRTMFILFRVENMSQDAIGASYGISASAVKQHVAKAVAMISRKMRDIR